MGNRKTFNDFDTKNASDIHADDYLIGFDIPDVGGEKKFKLSSLKNYIKSVDVVVISSDSVLPINSPFATENDVKENVPYLNGQTFHVESSDHVLIELPNLRDFVGVKRVMCVVMNLTDNKRVEIKTVNGMKSLRARGVVEYDSQLSDSTTVTFLKKKYDTGIFYYSEDTWYGYGDLDGPSSLNIKNIYDNYTFTLEDEDKILHFHHDASEGGVMVNLPDPSLIKSGTQFFVHNISEQWIEFAVPTGINFHARAKFLRGKYDDAAVYTDGVDWFATGDLS